MNAYEIAKLIYSFLGHQFLGGARDWAIHPVAQMGALDEAYLSVSHRTDAGKIRTYKITIKFEDEV